MCWWLQMQTSICMRGQNVRFIADRWWHFNHSDRWCLFSDSSISSYRNQYINAHQQQYKKTTNSASECVVVDVVLFMCVVSDSLRTMSKPRCPMTLIQSIEWYFKMFFSFATKVPRPCALNQLKNDLQVNCQETEKNRRNKYANENQQFKIDYFSLNYSSCCPMLLLRSLLLFLFNCKWDTA